MAKVFGCVNNTIRLRSGLYFDLINPLPECFTINDIACGLSKICRFGGQCERFYSVAEHCYHCSMAAAAAPLACLLHDAAEAFIGDMVKPLKVLMPEYKKIERGIEKVIACKYGVDFEQEEIKEIDHSMLIAERKSLFSKDNVKWTGEDEAVIINVHFECWNHQQAEDEFLKRAYFLGIRE